METTPKTELEQTVDRLFDETDKLAFEAMNKITNLLRKEKP